MVLQFIAQALRNAEELRQRVLRSTDLINDNEALTARLQLQKIYQQVILLDLEYAIDKKVEQELWNLGFKNYIDALQKLAKDRKNPKRSEYQGLLNACLESASGFYLILLEEICVTFSFCLPFPSYRKYSYLQSNTKKSQLEHLINQPKKSSCCYICQHCLVHLGDIARYKFRCKQAEIYYRNAIVLSPSSGQPYNQLALLETCRGDKLATVFYYVRSIAVRNPFPAATSNLALTLNKANVNTEWNPDNEAILSTNEFTTLFLKVHALLHLSTDILPCSTYVRLLSTSLTAHVATESFTSINLVQMMVINMYAYHNVNTEGGRLVEDSQLTADEKLIKTLLTELIAGSLNAFLLPIYTYKQEDSLLQYFALPAIKITLDWIRINSHVLEQPSFVNRPQIWPAFCKLINELGPLLKSFHHDKLKNVTLPEDQDIQGFIPLQSAIPEFRYTDNELDLDNLGKLRACRIQSFATWLAKETKYSLIELCKEESDYLKFEATIAGAQSSNELIIQQLEELLKNDCSLSSEITTDSNKDAPSNRSVANNIAKKSSVSNVPATSASPLIASLSDNNKRAGILKTQSFLDKKDKSFNNDAKKQARQNVALQTILKRNQEQEHKQVTFKTPSPSLSTSSDNQESGSPSVNHSQLWPNHNFAATNISQQSLQQPSHSMFMSSFPSYPDSFRTLPSHSSGGMLPQQSTMNFNNKNSQYYQQNLNADVQRNFAAQLYQKPPFVSMSNERIIDPFTSNLNSANETRNQNIIDGNRLAQIPDNRHIQRNQFANQISNLNFLPPWKQQDPNSWWMDDKQKVMNSGGITGLEDQTNSLFHYRNSVPQSPASQTSNIPFGGNSQLQFQPQQPPPPPQHQIRQIPQQPPQQQHQQQLQPAQQHQQQMQSAQQHQQQLQSAQHQQQLQSAQQTHLRSPNTPNIPVGYWPNSYKQSPPQNNVNSIFNTNLLNKQPLFDTTYNQTTAVPNSEDKTTFASHSQLPNNTYSLFSPMWSSPSTIDNQPNQSSNNNPLAVLTTHQSIWSEGISPLQRLLEQQKQMRDRSMYHNSQQSPSE